MTSYLNRWQLKGLRASLSLDQPMQKKYIFKMGLFLLFAVAGLIRLYHIQEPGTLIDREYTSAIFARAFYYEHTDSAANWQKEISKIAKEYQPVLEPPITDYVVSIIYRLIGSEQLWVSHVITSLFWLIGGIFFYKLVQIAVSPMAAVIATSYYLFTPLSIIVSRSFQPDSLMMMLYLACLYGIYKYFEKPTTKSLIVVGMIAGLALLVRPLILFALLGAFIFLAFNRSRSWKFVYQKDVAIFFLVSLLPAALYYGYGIIVAGFLRWKVDTSFRPDLYLREFYWTGWLRLAVNGIGFLFMVGAIVGLSTISKSKTKMMLGGLWLGYIIFGLVFTMHIHTHPYYHAQLIPIVAISFSSLAAAVIGHIRQLGSKWFVWIPVAAAILLVLYFDIGTVREQVGSQVFESKELAQQVGELTNHSSRTILISRYYGLPLEYYGELAGSGWPKAIEHPTYRRSGERALTIQERMDAIGFKPEYFVITDFENYSTRHQDLKVYLETYCSIVAQGDGYQIYDSQCEL